MVLEMNEKSKHLNGVVVIAATFVVVVAATRTVLYNDLLSRNPFVPMHLAVCVVLSSLLLLFTVSPLQL